LEAVVATIDDITERDRAESQLRRSMDLLDEAQRLASLGHYVLDFETGMWESSEALEELFGIGPDYPHDVEGWLGLVHPDDREAMRAYLEERVIGRREPFDREYRIVRVSDGQMRWVHGLGRLVDGRDGVLLHMIGTIQDVTEARAVERELKAHRERLEGLVEERTEELRLLNEQLLQATKAKSDFLASMSHELRTPLNSIIGFSGILLRGMAGELNDEQHHQIEMINRSGRTLLALIGDVLDLAKIEAGRIELQPVEFDPAQAVAEIMEDVEPLAREKALETAVIVEEAPASVTVDPAKFGQIVRNMVSNAIKFTATGGVTVTVRGEGADTFCVDVRDTGIGIADEDISRVFEAFKQVEPQDETVAKYSGTGLGLTIARDYARLMGGDITVRSHVGSGTTFTLTLPLG
jgi:PAS domain S-box-containing protein